MARMSRTWRNSVRTLACALLLSLPLRLVFAVPNYQKSEAWKQTDVSEYAIDYLVYGSKFTEDQWEPYAHYRTTLVDSDKLFEFLAVTQSGKEPAMRMISHGLRDVPNGDNFRFNLDYFAYLPDETEDWKLYTLKVMNKKYPGDFREAFLDEVKTRYRFLNSQTWQIEHFFECRFTGPLLRHAAGDDIDNSFWPAMTMLRSIVNHKYNLVYIPDSLSSVKNKFFSHVDIPFDDDETTIMLLYFLRMRGRFKALVDHVAEMSVEAYEAGNVLMRMLKLLTESPFYTGNWGSLMYWKYCDGDDTARCLDNLQLHPNCRQELRYCLKYGSPDEAWNNYGQWFVAPFSWDDLVERYDPDAILDEHDGNLKHGILMNSKKIRREKFERRGSRPPQKTKKPKRPG